ncbi:EAL domain-containing protein [Rhodopila sp.]|uniref:EAL domain-containing protein n=1 Tax=Rhodopila sp. TaxID=2480087 RepID=UPI003D11EAB2
MFSVRSIRTRILVSFLLMLATVVALSLAVLRASGELEAALSADATSQRFAQQSGAVRTILLEARLGVANYLLSGGTAERDALEATTSRLERAAALADESRPVSLPQGRLALGVQVRAMFLSVAEAIEQRRAAAARLSDAAAVLNNSATTLAETAARVGDRSLAEPASSMLSAISRALRAAAYFTVLDEASQAAIATTEATRAGTFLDGWLNVPSSPPRIQRVAAATSAALDLFKAATDNLGVALRSREQRLAGLAEASDRLAATTAQASLAIAAERQQRRTAILRAQAELRTTVTWATIAVGLFGLSITIGLVLSITRSTRRLATAMASIATGTSDRTVLSVGKDELGQLLVATEAMRARVQAMVECEVEERRSAQTRLVDALEGSREGIVLVDSAGRLVLVNSQMSRFHPGETTLLQSGADFAAFAVAIGAPAVFEADAPDVPEIRLGDGRWVRVSRSATQDGGFVAITSDITALKQREAELRETNLRFDAALANMSQGLALFDAEHRLQVSNRRLAEIWQLPASSLQPGVTMRHLLDLSVKGGNHGKRAVSEVQASYLAMVTQARKSTVVQTFGNGRVVAVSHQPLQDGGWVATFDDITERRQSEARIVFLAHHDALTGLPNRVLLRERLDQAIAQLGRGTVFALLCLDLDNFKTVNDTLGHPVGDKLLQAVADRLGFCVRETDTVARLGGDEFAIVQVGITAPEDAGELAGRVVATLSRPYDIDGQQVIVGASVGIAVAPGDGSNWDKLLKNADMALYRAKSDGKGLHRWFEQEMDARLQQRHRLEWELRQALPNNELELFYQPLVNLASDRVSSFEALLRWRHPQRGLVSPGEFIPLAEETGLIVPIGEWVLRRACADAASWPDGIKVAVNVSAIQFRSSRLAEAVNDALTDAGLPAQRLELEVTESVLLRDSDATLATLHQLRRLGSRIALDDFGTGYSSLSYLRSFPFDKLKIDRSFVRDLADNPEAAAIVRAITQLATALGMTIAAEGIETEAQLACLRKEACTEGQGYLFSRPVPADVVSTLLERLSPLNGVARARTLARV